jgi:hypothetical protein
MKKNIVLMLVISGMLLQANGQENQFFINLATTAGNTCKCGELKSVKVTFNIPANVNSYDEYYLYVSLSSLDVTANIVFDKSAIATKLAGKKTYSAFLIKQDGTSDFSFDDTKLSMKDLCSTPRMWGFQTVDITASGIGYHIVGHHYEDKWNEYYKRWDSKKIADYDDGVAYGEGTISVEQRPLSEGFYDDNEHVFVKVANTDSATYSVSSDILKKGALAIDDKSTDGLTTITYAYFDAATMSYDQLKENILNSISGKYQVGFENPFYDVRSITSSNQKQVSGKSSEFKSVTINGINYETLTYCQISGENTSQYQSEQPGYYLTYFVTKVGANTVGILSKTDELFIKVPGLSMMDKATYNYTFKLSDENLLKVDAINNKWLEGTSYKF